MITATGKRAERLREFTRYIQSVGPGGAGKLSPGEGESTMELRRRLNQAARAVGKTLAIRRQGDDVYFWIEESPRRQMPFEFGGAETYEVVESDGGIVLVSTPFEPVDAAEVERLAKETIEEHRRTLQALAR